MDAHRRAFSGTSEVFVFSYLSVDFRNPSSYLFGTAVAITPDPGASPVEKTWSGKS
jgi:hypothetical protein